MTFQWTPDTTGLTFWTLFEKLWCIFEYDQAHHNLSLTDHLQYQWKSKRIQESGFQEFKILSLFLKNYLRAFLPLGASYCRLFSRKYDFVSETEKLLLFNIFHFVVYASNLGDIWHCG